MIKRCCVPIAEAGEALTHPAALAAVEAAPAAVRADLKSGLVAIPGGFCDVGTRKSRFPEDRDSPRRRVKVAPFLMSPTAVSNAEFAAFVQSTGYRTVAEREGWSFVFHLFLKSPDSHLSPPGLPWWRRVEGAFWAAPEGPGSTIKGRENHPAVHVSWFDAAAYCRWSGLRLPGEVEWERAARGGIERAKFPWGNALHPGGKHAMNVWQGRFPDSNSGEDGFLGTAPVDSYAANGFGMFNMTGNVWEWAADMFDSTATSGSCLYPERVQRGGSYLCHVDYCDRYHVHSRIGTEPDSSAGHSGFRVAADL